MTVKNIFVTLKITVEKKIGKNDFSEIKIYFKIVDWDKTEIVLYYFHDLPS